MDHSQKFLNGMLACTMFYGVYRTSLMKSRIMFLIWRRRNEGDIIHILGMKLYHIPDAQGEVKNKAQPDEVAA